MNRDRAMTLYSDPVFATVCDLEETVRDIERLSHALVLLAAGMDGPEWEPICAIAEIINDRAEEFERMRGELFDLTHPSREAWEKAGGLERWRQIARKPSAA